MKKTLTILGVLAGTAGVYAQGTINMADYEASPAFNISVFAPSTTTPGVQSSGNTAADSPAGTQTYSGQAIGGSTTGTGPFNYANGNNYTVGLYLATTQAGLVTALTGAPVGTTTFNTTASGIGNWTYSALNITDNNISPGTPVFVELAAWDNNGGAITSYAAALAANLPAGHSVASTGTDALGGGSPPVTAPGLGGLGLTSFNLTTTVPEPSTIAMGIMGASAFLFRRRK